MVRCPVCGTRLDFAEVKLTDRQKAIREAIETLKRQNGKWPYSWEVAYVVELSDGFVRRELRHMETIGILSRDGPRSGWKLRSEHITVILA
jgi:predicted transcriptional regulator